MGRYASEGEKQSTGTSSFKQAPAGTYIARCFKIVDIGTQHSEYLGKPTARKQIIVMWELPDETIDTPEGPKPYVVSKFYTNNLYEKSNLFRDLTSWRGVAFTPQELEKFDLESIIGKPCLLTVEDTGVPGKTKVGAVTRMLKGQVCPPQVNESFTFWLDAPLDRAKFDQLSEGLQKMIVRSDEYIALTEQKIAAKPQTRRVVEDDDFESDIPF